MFRILQFGLDSITNLLGGITADLVGEAPHCRGRDYGEKQHHSDEDEFHA